jgi:hypothetical protein
MNLKPPVMKKIILLLHLIVTMITNAQNSFTTYTANLYISGTSRVQTAFLVDNTSTKWFGYRTLGTAANAGLVKYDNVTWTLYNQTSTPAFPSNRVTCLAKDNSGNIWIGCDSGLVKFDGNVFTTYSTAQGLPVKPVNCVEVVGNQVYVGTNSGLSRFDGVSFTNYNVSSGTLPINVITSIKAESFTKIWLGGFNRLIEFNINASFSNTSFVDYTIPQTAYYSFSSSANSGIVNCIYIDTQNDKWLGTTFAGIVKYNGTTFKNANELYEVFGSSIPLKVTDITTGFHNGIIFRHKLGTEPSAYSGLTELAPKGKVFQYFHPTYNFNLGEWIERSGNAILLSQGSPGLVPNAPIMYHKFDTINYRQPLGAVTLNNFKTLDINQVKAGISNRSDMHWDIGGTQNAMYEVPKGSGANSNFATALWIGGLDAGGQLHGGAQTYRQSGVDFWPGPLDTITATIDTTTSLAYDKIWKVSYSEINTFVSAFNSGSVVATPDMLTWPAHGVGNQSRNLAPFEDHNGDGIYNPYDGDYPKIKGDQALYFIYNDKLAAHSTSFTPMGIEVQGMAYAYGCPTVLNGRNELAYTTFYDYKIINRSPNNYHDVYVSMWSDADLGYYADDYIGSNVDSNYGYIYNGDSYDETTSGMICYGTYIPSQGFNILKGPEANSADGIDNNNNGIIDEPGEDCKMNKFNYFNYHFAGTPMQITDPTIAQEYYNYMTGYWKYGTPFTCGGSGYGGSIQTNWVYPGDPTNGGLSTDPANTCGSWIEPGVIAGNRRMILSSGPFTLNAGQTQEVEYAFVTSFDSSTTTNSNLLSVAKLKTDIQKVNTFYNIVNKPHCLQTINVGINEYHKSNVFTVYPNPAKSSLTVSGEFEKNEKVKYEITDLIGRTVLTSEVNASEKFSIPISSLNTGVYFLKIQVNNSIEVKKFIKE